MAVSRALLLEIEERTGIKPNLAKNVLNAMAEVATETIMNGDAFTVPGIAKLDWAYRKPLKKGENYKKGDTRVNNITKEESIAEADSPARKASVRLKAAPVGAVKKDVPKPRDEAAQRKFLTTKAGKHVASRKG